MRDLFSPDLKPKPKIFFRNSLFLLLLTDFQKSNDNFRSGLSISRDGDPFYKKVVNKTLFLTKLILRMI